MSNEKVLSGSCFCGEVQFEVQTTALSGFQFAGGDRSRASIASSSLTL